MIANINCSKPLHINICHIYCAPLTRKSLSATMSVWVFHQCTEFHFCATGCPRNQLNAQSRTFLQTLAATHLLRMLTILWNYRSRTWKHSPTLLNFHFYTSKDFPLKPSKLSSLLRFVLHVPLISSFLISLCLRRIFYEECKFWSLPWTKFRNRYFMKECLHLKFEIHQRNVGFSQL
jgi:hypothetical protein